MNVGRDKRHPKYVCDKCKKEIHYQHHKGFDVNKYYKQGKYDYTCKKDFDLCNNCEKKFREWLNIKELETAEEMLDKFPRYEEG